MVTKQKTEQTPKADSHAETDQDAAMFTVVAQFARDVSIECRKPAFVVEKPDVLKMTLDVGVGVRPVGDDLHEVAVRLRGEGKDDKGETCYLCEVDYAGVFGVRGVPAEHLLPLLSIDAAGLVYPFARQVFMDGVMATGYRPKMLEAINFHGLFMQAQQEQAAAAAEHTAQGKVLNA